MNDLVVASPVAALSVIPGLVKVAKEQGYALTVHGTLARDFDFVAIPWTAEAASAEKLVEAIVKHTGGYFRRNDYLSQKPHGRKAWSIYFNGENDAYIDLSVMPLLFTQENHIRSLVDDKDLYDKDPYGQLPDDDDEDDNLPLKGKLPEPRFSVRNFLTFPVHTRYSIMTELGVMGENGSVPVSWSDKWTYAMAKIRKRDLFDEFAAKVGEVYDDREKRGLN